MSHWLDACWRAAAYCLHPRVILWSLAPLLLALALVLGLGWFYWEAAVAAVRATLEQWALTEALLQWLDAVGASGLRAVVAPLIVIALVVPVIVVGSLLLVAWLMTPSIVDLVARRRFPSLQRRGSRAAWGQGLAWSLGCTVVALLLLAASLPLWLVPPLALLLPALIWGWLTAKVLAFDTLAAHASADERRRVLHAQAWPLLAIGICCGLLGAAPSLIWAVGAVTVIFAPLIAVLSVWLYTLVFAFAALWFAHFGLARLERLRAEDALAAGGPAAAAPSTEPPRLTAPEAPEQPPQRLAA